MIHTAFSFRVEHSTAMDLCISCPWQRKATAVCWSWELGRILFFFFLGLLQANSQAALSKDRWGMIRLCKATDLPPASFQLPALEAFVDG